MREKLIQLIETTSQIMRSIEDAVVTEEDRQRILTKIDELRTSQLSKED